MPDVDERVRYAVLLARIAHRDEAALADLILMTHHLLFAAVVRVLGDQALDVRRIAEVDGELGVEGPPGVEDQHGVGLALVELLEFVGRHR